ncbi:NAD(P)-dependent dehydrogenase (short-subunit alcohol dehydrogenase family) [Rhizobium leguminosarum]|uniref:NAD(P)-dependent dehydrogenase (Short-subunit alcohol dehydrogenase family) n=1 Tax=Rhizobium leguminosarum TaxID=384 RepID=A0AAE2MLI3_RHILE|nr:MULTISPECIES: SDR family oxidoreductase [Rhizobium]MBB4291429.1 NAD(P)-dependent dehydrogenase (short-subunit alcohol dehydrogenase family) [Rhizobium leguminosarum]MBB4296125.1 NAD(P)-dependent dehydrogenase (short-subunit alcohol dehydrogenase family) [Rhizobium leguminosarum]MBB4308616.1 NAD(P)-dependent dehydrogenase (short-subunit alcohol dehydrogenase family) [Rhizobium leguminosarum]MBB4416451.1 NAD(P)-dependent dehydrogenase (short-subunit alcohol dehydrogenase family) [Rhizobium leg
MTSLNRQRVLVVGGSSGIGLAVAEQAAQAGANVTIASRSAAKLEQSATRFGGNVTTHPLDTADDVGIEDFFAKHEPWDHIVISAAQTASGPIKKLPLNDAKSAMESKFWGAYRVAKVARIVDRGSLTFISGYLGERPNAASVLQGAINAALDALARGLALELSPTRVNTVSPGLIDTPLWSKMEPQAKDAMFGRAAAMLPAKTVGHPSDVANAVLYLMTTPFATGSTVRVDGGGVIA